MKTNIILRDYQQESFLFLKSDFEKLVLAMCPSSGKTETIIYYIDYLYSQNKNIKVLVLPHSTNVLLNNFYERLTQKNVAFSYSTDTSVDCNVHIVLPQSYLKIKDQYNLLVVDEAHENYFANTIQNIISKIKPKKQILLTGTPYKFIGKNDFKIHFLALNELNKNTIPKLRVDIIESNYDWNGNYNFNRELKKNFEFNNTDTKATLDKTFEFIFNRNNSKSISKTLIVCNNIQQSKYVNNYLDNIGLISYVSNSENDTKSELVQDFKQNKINILIVVNRARMGYDDVDLINLIDMSGTLNPNIIYQMIARCLRGSNDIQKYYIRLTSKKDETLNSEIATNLALMLTDKNYISKFNGKNFNNQAIIIPYFFSKKHIKNISNVTKNSPKLLVDADDMISFYKDTISEIEKQNGIYKFCKVSDVLKTLGVNVRNSYPINTLESCKKSASKFNSRGEWFKLEKRCYAYAHKKGWLDECCSHMKLINIKRTLESCKKSASKYNSRSEWKKADNASYAYAKNYGWLNECCSHMKLIYRKHTLESCKKIATKYKTKSEWKKTDSGSYSTAEKNGWLDECCSHMKTMLRYHTLESCKNSASKFNSRGEWYKLEPCSYAYAQRKGWLDECCSHMKLIYRKHTLESCKKSASKFNSRGEWQKSDGNSYRYAYRHGWLNECCKYFKK
jgi:superfamily II DNA or RNA helicase